MSKAAPTRDRCRIVLGYGFAGISCVMGLFFCLIQSPQTRSDSYRALAAESAMYHQNDQAEQAAREAIRLNPLSPENWRVLSYILREKGQEHDAMRAVAIARQLARPPSAKDTIYAMPAEFKLSFLALNETDIP